MPSKGKKTDSSVPRRVYTTRQIMEITEERRLKSDLANRMPDPEIKEPKDKPVVAVDDLKLPVLQAVTKNPRILEEIKTFVDQVNIRPSQEITGQFTEIKSENPMLINDGLGFLIFILSFAVSFLFLSLKSSGSWMNILVIKLNSLIINGSVFVLNLFHEPVEVKGAVLTTDHFRVSLQDDWCAFYSLELLITFTLALVALKRANWIKNGIIFASLIPLVIISNVIRVVASCGIALNEGIYLADQNFHGLLLGFVFLFNVFSFFFFVFLLFPD